MVVIVQALKLVVGLPGETTAAVLTQMPFAALMTKAVALQMMLLPLQCWQWKTSPCSTI